MTNTSEQAYWREVPSVNIGLQSIAVAGRGELAEVMAHDCLSSRLFDRVGKARLVMDANGQGVSLYARDQVYRSAVDAAHLVHADGGFLVTFSRWFSQQPIQERSATTDLIHDFAERAVRDGLSFYLLGGQEATNAAACDELQRRYPGLNIAGRRNGYFSEEQIVEVLEDINRLNPDVLWVGLGKPKEQLFAARWASAIRAGWIVTCGGCYSYITGEYSRAPGWMQRWNLEWAHRMFTRPRQLLWRYMTTTPHALWVVFANRDRS